MEKRNLRFANWFCYFTNILPCGQHILQEIWNLKHVEVFFLSKVVATGAGLKLNKNLRHSLNNRNPRSVELIFRIFVTVTAPLLVLFIWNSLQNSGAKYVNTKMPRQFQNFPVCLGNVSTKTIVEDSAETLVYYVGNGFGMPQHFA